MIRIDPDPLPAGWRRRAWLIGLGLLLLLDAFGAGLLLGGWLAPGGWLGPGRVGVGW